MTATTAETTLLAALDRTYRGRPAKPSIYRRLHEMLDPEETVHCVADGYRDYTSEHLLLLTDHRVLLVKAPIPGRWKAMRDVPATAVLGGRQVTGTLTAASVEIGVRGQKPVTMKIGSHEAAAELLRTLEALRADAAPGGLSEGNGAPPETDEGATAASVPSEVQGLLARGERVHSVFEGWSTWSSEHQLLVLTAGELDHPAGGRGAVGHRRVQRGRDGLEGGLGHGRGAGPEADQPRQGSSGAGAGLRADARGPAAPGARAGIALSARHGTSMRPALR